LNTCDEIELIWPLASPTVGRRAAFASSKLSVTPHWGRVSTCASVGCEKPGTFVLPRFFRDEVGCFRGYPTEDAAALLHFRQWMRGRGASGAQIENCFDRYEQVNARWPDMTAGARTLWREGTARELGIEAADVVEWARHVERSGTELLGDNSPADDEAALEKIHSAMREAMADPYKNRELLDELTRTDYEILERKHNLVEVPSPRPGNPGKLAH
jgi:hypothetical protein